MARVIIGIHGLANKPSTEILTKWWKESIVEGLEVNCGVRNPEIKFTMVHWADLLYKYPQHQDKHFTFDSLYNKEPYKRAPKSALRPYEENWLDRVRAKTQSVAGRTVDAVREYVGMDALADFFLQRILKDLHFYYDSKRKITDRRGRRRQAKIVFQKELQDVLVANRDTTIMLIAHSMGSIIAYDVLRNLGRTHKGVRISHFVTIGSPLGLPTVKARIHQERRYAGKMRVRTPSVVMNSWVNFADRKDPVAVDTHLRDDYGPNSRGVQVVDDLILNDYKIGGKNNHHKSYGYLRTPEVSEHMREFLRLKRAR